MQKRDELLEELFSVSDAITRMCKEYFLTIFQNEDINIGQLHTLLALKEGQPLLGKELASRLHVTPSSITQMLEGLAQKDCIERRQDKQDRRNVYIRLTAKGEAKLQQVRAARLIILTAMNKPLTDNELQADLDRQRKIMAHMQTISSTSKEQ